MRTVLLGDSHLDRVRRDLPRIATGQIVNAAVGGAVASDLRPQAHRVPVVRTDRIVVSIGTNDAASWSALPLDAFAGELRRFLDDVRPSGPVFVSSPGVVEARLVGASARVAADVAEYASVAAALFRDAGGVVVDSARVLAPLGDRAFCADGVHLTGAGYDALLPAIAAALG